VQARAVPVVTQKCRDIRECRTPHYPCKCYKKPNLNLYKPLKMGFDKRRGLHQLYPHRWATEYTLTGSLMEKNRPLPKLVQSVSTNGIEVKVLLYKMVKQPSPKDKP